MLKDDGCKRLYRAQHNIVSRDKEANEERLLGKSANALEDYLAAN